MKFELDWHSSEEIPDKHPLNDGVDRYQLVVYVLAYEHIQIDAYCFGYYSNTHQCWIDPDTEGAIESVLRWCYLPGLNTEGSIQRSKMSRDRYGFYH